MSPRFFVLADLAPGIDLTLPPDVSRHVQVLRLQPGAELTLFDGRGGQWTAEVLDMGRKQVTARVQAHEAIDRELNTPITLALGIPANERMDTLVEKATELGVAAIVPLLCERSVLRVSGERAERKSAHWQAIAVAACEQSGRNRVPQVAVPLGLREWLSSLGASQNLSPKRRWMLSLAPGAQPLVPVLQQQAGLPALVLSGPEGGLSPAEMAMAAAAGFQSLTLGPRVLRADTAPLAVLACAGALENLAP
jgi:16S rRNA (uracil1498-N3)-methyltransferase